MTLEDILNREEFSFPVKNNTGDSYVSFIENLLIKYLTLLKTNRDIFDNCVETIMVHEQYIKKIERNITALIEIINDYRQGKRGDLETKFLNYMSRLSPFLFSNKDFSIQIASNSFFFRARYLETEYHMLKPKEYFFHTPFQIEEYTGSTRFSSAGIPSLYLTDNLYSGFLETNSNNIDQFQVVKYSNKIDLRLFNLNFYLPDKPNSDAEISEIKEYDTKLQTYGLIFPLLLVCYCKRNSHSVDPPEYIISQLLSTWLKNCDNFDGIEYSSTKVDNSLNIGKFKNFMIFPKEICKEGFCNWLKSEVFTMSEVYSWYHYKELIDSFPIDSGIDRELLKLDVLEIIWPVSNTYAVDYLTTDIGKFDYYLRIAVTTSAITF